VNQALKSSGAIINQKVLEPLLYLILTIIVRILAVRHHLPSSGLHRSNPRIIAYFIPSCIQTPPRVKNVDKIFGRSCANQQRIEKLKEIKENYSSKLQFSIQDCLHTFPLLGHSIWYCVIQSPCTSTEDATTWNCYNAFGYRVYNYLFPSYFHFACTFIMKCAYRNKIKKFMVKQNTKLGKLSYYLGLYSSVITFIFVSCLVLPYLLTHVLPMAFAYVFMHAIYFTFIFIVLIVGVFFLHLWCIIDSRITISSVVIGASVLYTFPLLISVTYNYSQYLFYGQDYFETMTNEYNTRDTPTYFKLLHNSVNFLFHTILNFF